MDHFLLPLATAIRYGCCGSFILAKQAKDIKNTKKELKAKRENEKNASFVIMMEFFVFVCHFAILPFTLRGVLEISLMQFFQFRSGVGLFCCLICVL